ncbi:MAG: 2-isopropylmalate synthase [Clostridia bacterium]|nr:2-isopropylmalate synthase [Clostridia bacterium]
MKNAEKYQKQFFAPPPADDRWAEKNAIEAAPLWCSVDLRDGNQALEAPMDPEEKLALFDLLVKIGFTEIEIGFPAASDSEWTFVRRLIEEDRIPDGVTVQVVTQAREPIIRRTFEALRGVKKATVHLYNSVSKAQREQVFCRTKEEILALSAEGAALMRAMQEEYGTDYIFEYTPESFTGTEPEFALSVIEAVLDVWEPTPARKAIVNLPVTVELSLPHVYAKQVAYISSHLARRDSVILSLHAHNDRGCAVADIELGLLAGGERVEGTLFGNGERAGNVDLVTLALNLYSQGVDPLLDFSSLPAIAETCELLTHRPVYDRHPYAGKLVFAAFSGSHQDAIAKGIHYRETHPGALWSVPYLPVDPADLGRDYEGDVIRITSQSGKGGIGYLLEKHFGLQIPAKMRECVGRAIKEISDRERRELSPDEVHTAFLELFCNVETPLRLLDYDFIRTPQIHATLRLERDGAVREYTAGGNGRLDAIAAAVREAVGVSFSDMTYAEHALESGSSSQAVSYVSVTMPDGSVSWGAGVSDDIIASSVSALLSAVNRALG